nr:FkbM family methyltransferase [Sedimentibacter sp.]
MEKSFEEIFEEILKDDTKESTNIWKEKLLHTEKPIVLFGAGSAGHGIADCLSLWGIKPTCFCDNFKIGIDEKYQLPIISFEKLKEDYREAYIIISLGMENVQNIQNQLLQAGFIEENIISRIWVEDKLPIEYIIEHYEDYKWVYENLEDDLSREILIEKINYSLYYFEMKIRYESYSNQYFEESIIKLEEDEVFVDGGAYIGDTVLEFINRTNNNYNVIYSFEPDGKNFQRLLENCSGLKNIKIINKGLWNAENVLKFSADKEALSAFEEMGDIRVHVTSLDNILLEDHIEPTFIKYDIEGSEYEALLGAKTVVQKYKPKLAICVYHKKEDLYEIPKLIKTLCHEYKLYLRHYSNSNGDTICYAV